MNNEVLFAAIDALEDAAPVDAEWLQQKNKAIPGDGFLMLKTNKREYIFVALVRQELREIQIPKLTAFNKEHTNLIVIARETYPNIGKQLQERGINYIDTLGNIYIAQEDLLLLLKGEKQDKNKRHYKGRAFNRAGMVFTFYLLTNEDFLKHTYRQMGQLCDTALGNITYIMKDLHDQGFLVKRRIGNWQIQKRKELIEAWVEKYPEKLKNNCILGTFRLQHPEEIENWKNLNIDRTKTQWGGEPGAELLTNYLKPATLTIYTEEERKTLIKNLRLLPAPEGNIMLYTKFWHTEDRDAEAVHPIIVYADLLEINDPRTDEVANMIYDEYLKEKF